MLRLSFEDGWVKPVMNCISTVSYTVNVNRSNGVIFQPSRELRQGEPLSPFLFLLCSEGLSSLMRDAMRRGLIRGAKASRRGPPISHLLFTDDSILFGEALKTEAEALKSILRTYENCSGQSVNISKSTIFFSSNTREEDKLEVSRVLGMRFSANPKRYLGLPNMVGRNKRASFQHLKDRIKSRIDGWSIRVLFQGSKEVFVKSILQAISTYTLNYFLIPKSFCKEIKSLLARFRWQKGHQKRGIHWYEWRHMCKLKEDGGRGFRDMGSFNVALLAKQGWRIMQNPNSLISKVLQAKYFPHSNFINSSLGNTSSYTWRSIWASKGILHKGMGWRVGNGMSIGVNDDAWIVEAPTFKVSNPPISMYNVNVAELIDVSTRKWKEEMIIDTFDVVDASQIIRIPLFLVPHDDRLVWYGEASGEYSVRSAY